jgi:hypothetical protein
MLIPVILQKKPGVQLNAAVSNVLLQKAPIVHGLPLFQTLPDTWRVAVVPAGQNEPLEQGKRLPTVIPVILHAKPARHRVGLLMPAVAQKVPTEQAD